MSELKQDVYELVSELMHERGMEIDDSMTGSDLVEGGVLDSMGIVNLVARLEERFDVTFEADELESQSLHSINGIVAMLSTRR